MPISLDETGLLRQPRDSGLASCRREQDLVFLLLFHAPAHTVCLLASLSSLMIGREVGADSRSRDAQYQTAVFNILKMEYDTR